MCSDFCHVAQCILGTGTDAVLHLCLVCELHVSDSFPSPPPLLFLPNSLFLFLCSHSLPYASVWSKVTSIVTCLLTEGQTEKLIFLRALEWLTNWPHRSLTAPCLQELPLGDFSEENTNLQNATD
jgi:hypothetical protein